MWMEVKKMKKLICAFVICMLGLTTVSATAFAADNEITGVATNTSNVKPQGDSEFHKVQFQGK